MKQPPPSPFDQLVNLSRNQLSIISSKLEQAVFPHRLSRLVRILSAHIRCTTYLINKGMWQEEGKFCGWDKDGKLLFIATGNIFDSTIVVKKVFWNEHEPETSRCQPEPGSRNCQIQ